MFTGVAPRAFWAPYFLDDQFEVEAFHVSVPARQAESPVAVLPAVVLPAAVLPAAESPVAALLAAESPVVVWAW